MKKIALITIRNEMKNMYFEELNSIFSEYLDIIPYSLEVDHKYQTNNNLLNTAEIVLLTNPNIFSIVKDLVRKDCTIINLDYTFLKNKVETLKTFPQDTSALVCFNFYEVSLHVATMIYEMGITNLNLTVYNPETRHLDGDYYIAIVGANSAIVPEKISRIVSLGGRKITFSTLIDLAVAANVLDDKLENRIFSYSKELALPNSFMNNVYANSSFTKMQLQTIMDCIDYSIMILDSDFKIVNYNMYLINMFNIKREILNKDIKEIIEFKPFSEHKLINREIKNVLIKIKDNKNVMLTIKRINNTKINLTDAYIILLKDVTEIIKLENTLQKQLAKKGHITKYNFNMIYGNSKEIKECIREAKIIAKLNKTALIIGESGTGKELFAQSMHSESPRKNYPFIGINCAALPSTLLESELFGYEDGTFTGGRKGGKSGLIELANNGTLFLDEIGDMALETQAKLLRVLEEKEFMKLGSGEVISVNVRIIAATNRDLKTMVKEGKFRLDLFYRLNTLTINIPPLRKRKEDVAQLINLFIKAEGINTASMDEDVFNFMVNYSWEGNVRELKNCIEYMISVSDGKIEMNHLPKYILEESMESNEAIEQDIFYKLTQYEKDIAIDLMKIINYSSGGRRSVYKRLKDKYNSLSEYKLRNLITLLVENNLIILGGGRCGMKLSNLGKEFLELY